MSAQSSYAFEAIWHDGAKAALTAAGATPAYHARDLTAELPDSRVVAEASAFVKASGHMGRDSAGQLRYDHFTGTLTFIITTPRTEPGAARHDELIGKVREMCLAGRRAFASLPYQIMRIEDTGASITYIRDGERDRSELVYTIEIGLKPGIG